MLVKNGVGRTHTIHHVVPLFQAFAGKSRLREHHPSHKWLVFRRSDVAGFGRSMTAIAPTHWFVGTCFSVLKLVKSRGDWIRTSDLLVPNIRAKST